MISFHDLATASDLGTIRSYFDTQFTYTFENFFHPFVGDLIAQLNRDSLPGMLDAKWQDTLKQDFFQALYNPTEDFLAQVKYFQKEIDVSACGPYANYNWELFFHIPLTIAVHLSKMQRFAEAQRWFHYIFDPTSNDHTVDPPMRFWKFLAFRSPNNAMTIDEIVRILSTPRTELSGTDQCQQDSVLQGYYAILNKPFQPHVVARTRHLAYQYCVVMKYLDNLIAWGDHLFQQDTVESINEATQLYVLAANILGERPQRIPPLGKVKAKTFWQLKQEGLGPIGDALVDLEDQFPFNLAAPNSGMGGGGDSNALFGIGRTLYFCIPRNDKLLGYWDTVADRLFKIRHCMNIAGVVRPLALFDPPIDPGMLVKAVAAGIDISSIVSGLNQPIGPARSLLLIQKALELCGEVRGLGNALLTALEKGDAERLALVRQRHEIQIQQMAQDVRFLQWKSTQESTTSLLTSRKTALERLHYYQRLLGLPADQNAPDTIALDRRELTEENFDEAYGSLVGQYDKMLTLQKLSDLKLEGDSSPGILSGYSGNGKIYLTHNEDVELNVHLPVARDARLAASVFNALAAGFAPIPDADIDLHFWGIGSKVKLNVGTALVAAAKIAGDISGIVAGWEQDQAGMAARYASYERRADEWLLQYNLAAHELMQNGRQILTSLIAEQIAHHEYLNIQQQIANAQEVDKFLHEKFTNEDLYLWMQGEISRLYYEYYRFAFDTARKAEKTMKQELLRPEVDAQDFVKFNYWDGGRKGLLSGEALYLDVKRMEMEYHENNKRELELTKHVSLHQLNPLALLTLKATGTCQVTIPEWLYDLDCPGHYMRRIKSVALSIPSVVGPYTSVNCTLSLLRSSLRKSPIAGDDYTRQGSEDDRFVDYIGAVQSIVTSGGSNDSGLFETNLRDERFLPFEGAGAESTWKLELTKDYPAFDYSTISDVILHVRYTARQGVDPIKVKAALDDLFQQANQSNLVLLFSLRHDFPTEWAAFVSGAGDFTATIRKDYFPYFTQGKEITITGFDLYGPNGMNPPKHHQVGNQAVWDAATTDLGDHQAFTMTSAPDAVPGPTQVLTRTASADVFLIIRYSL
ncbi:toxin [Candidatus Acetothermia bacterium]|nr:toxin [Candidatus Acetothermia bacterium]